MPEQRSHEEIAQRMAQPEEPETLGAPEKSGVVWPKEAHATGEGLIAEMNQLAMQFNQAETRDNRKEALDRYPQG